ncbi:MAG: CsgG/HfaB family protein [Planctomycetota bacterium]|jgi:TolB-like protein
MIRLVCALVVALTGVSAIAADAPGPGKPPSAPPAELTVAVLSFEASDPGNPKLGGQIADALTAMLSGRPGFTLVERKELRRVLAEAELNLTGMVNTRQAVKVGKLVGARILVTGRAFALGKQMFITGKLIGVETSLVDGVLVKAEPGKDMGELVLRLAEKLAARLAKVGPKLAAGLKAPPDPLPKLKAALAKRRLPVAAVIVQERHYNRPDLIARRGAIDPPVETEIKRLLIACGIKVQDVKENDLTDFARQWSATDVNSWPRGLSGVDVVIAGKSFSEFAVRIGNLVTCSARAEINVIDRKTGRVVRADRCTTRAADLSPQIAAKKALQKAGHRLGIAALKHFAKTLPARGKKPPPAAKTDTRTAGEGSGR